LKNDLGGTAFGAAPVVGHAGQGVNISMHALQLLESSQNDSLVASELPLGAAVRSQDLVRLQVDGPLATAAQVVVSRAFAPTFSSDPNATLHRRGPSVRSQKIQTAATVFCFVVGLLVWLSGRKVAGLIILYFGVNTGFGLYMKFLLSDTEISADLGMQGLPAAFLVTAIQQVESFVLFAMFLLAVWPTEWRYCPRPLRSWRDVRTLTMFSFTFALNIGLNNLSISLLSVSLNLTIRSCLPLVTWSAQGLFNRLEIPTASGGRLAVPGAASLNEVLFMVIGTLFAVLATVAKGEDKYADDRSGMNMGVVVCGLSVIAAAFNLVFAAQLGSQTRLNPTEITMYLSLPSAAFLLPPIFMLEHPPDWPGSVAMTDWQVFQRVMALRPTALAAVLMSGVFAVGYNLLQYHLVQRLSATHTAFAGNVNKAVTITLSMLLGMERLPRGVWSVVMVLAVLGNIGSFTGYTIMKATQSLNNESDFSISSCLMEASPMVACSPRAHESTNDAFHDLRTPRRLNFEAK